MEKEFYLLIIEQSKKIIFLITKLEQCNLNFDSEFDEYGLNDLIENTQIEMTTIFTKNLTAKLQEEEKVFKNLIKRM